MPMISTKTNVTISPEQELTLKSKLGEAISILSGKSERWLMLSFEDKCHLYFQGNNSNPIAYVEVKVFGRCWSWTGWLNSLWKPDVRTASPKTSSKFSVPTISPGSPSIRRR